MAIQIKKSGPAWGQWGKEWLPKNSPDRNLDWSHRSQPRRVKSVSYSRPDDYLECFNCYEEALWYCDSCKMQFCRHDSCKEIHEYEHKLSRLGDNGSDEA